MSIDRATAQACTLISGLPGPLIEAVCDRSQLMRFEPNQQLFDCGSVCAMLPLVLNGSIRVFKRSESGREISLYRVTSDQLCIVTLGCLLGRNNYPATGVTEEAVSAISIPDSLFQELVVTHDGFRQMVFNQFSARITGLMQLVDEVAFQQLDRRLAHLLSQRGPEINESHQRIADELGSVREIVSRMLKQFEARGWILLARRKIQVIDRQGLEAYATGGSVT
jgi:CRP/FNR family transcriptional regulator